MREVARAPDSQPLRFGDDERAGGVGAAQPLLSGDRVVVEPGRVDVDRPHGLRAVDQHWQAAALLQLMHEQRPAGRPEDVRERDQLRPRRDGREDRVGIGGRDDDPDAARMEGQEQTGMLVGRRHDLVVRPEIEAGEHDVAAVGRRRCQRDLRRVDLDQRRELLPELLAEGEDALEVGLANASVVGARAELGLHRVEGRLRKRPEGARIEIRDALEHGEERPRLLDRHSMRASTGA